MANKEKAPSQSKALIRKMEKSMKDKKAAFLKKCNADLDLKDFEQKKKIALYALKLCRGNISNACIMINLGRKTFHIYISEDQDFADMVQDIKFTVVDHVESKLLENCDAGKETSIIYYLNCQGKDRGYGNALKLDGKVNNINYNVPLTEEEVRAYAKALEEQY